MTTEIPFSIRYDGASYYRTGKTGHNRETGHRADEYSNTEHGRDCRVWRNAVTREIMTD